MNRVRDLRFGCGFVVIGCALLMLATGRPLAVDAKETDSFTSSFDVQNNDLVSTGQNPFFVLEPGYQLFLAGGDEQLTITVLPNTKVVDGVETRVVEERETNKGQLVEVSRNYFAISKRTNSVFYFGEDVDIYSKGKLSSHEGAWVSGLNGAKFGMAMPGDQLLKGRYYQERAPRVAMDRAEIVSIDERLTTPAGVFDSVLKVLETTPLELLSREYKYYARGIGLVQDGSAKLVRYGKAEAQKN